jgi:hypothetical protein
MLRCCEWHTFIDSKMGIHPAESNLDCLSNSFPLPGSPRALISPVQFRRRPHINKTHGGVIADRHNFELLDDCTSCTNKQK